MANLITTSLTYSKEDAMNYFITPLFVQNSALEFFDVMMNVRSNTKLQRFTQIEKVTKAYVKGFNGATGSVLDQRAINVSRVEAEVEQEADVFFNTIMGELLKLGTAKDDLSDTDLQMIIAQIMMKAVSRDFERMIWLNDTGSASADYDTYDGIFKQLEALPAPQMLTGPIGALSADDAVAQFELTYAAATKEMKEDRSSLKMFVSCSYADNYRQSLQSGGTEAAFGNLQGGVDRLFWNGIEVVEMANWDTHIAGDALATDVHRIVLTNVSNIVIATDIESNNGAEFWYSLDDQCNRFRFGYVAGTQYRTDEMSVTNISA